MTAFHTIAIPHDDILQGCPAGSCGDGHAEEVV